MEKITALNLQGCSKDKIWVNICEDLRTGLITQDMPKKPPSLSSSSSSGSICFQSVEFFPTLLEHSPQPLAHSLSESKSKLRYIYIFFPLWIIHKGPNITWNIALFFLCCFSKTGNHKVNISITAALAQKISKVTSCFFTTGPNKLKLIRTMGFRWPQDVGGTYVNEMRTLFYPVSKGTSFNVLCIHRTNSILSQVLFLNA